MGARDKHLAFPRALRVHPGDNAAIDRPGFQQMPGQRGDHAAAGAIFSNFWFARISDIGALHMAVKAGAAVSLAKGQLAQRAIAHLAAGAGLVAQTALDAQIWINLWIQILAQGERVCRTHANAGAAARAQILISKSNA